ncbi:MAG: hypothetical protein R6X32_03805 [Chloroflexota bacterium]|jgi:hypothetical protein
MVTKEVTLPAAIAKIAPDGKLTPRQRRRILLEMALRRVRPGTGSSHEYFSVNSGSVT